MPSTRSIRLAALIAFVVCAGCVGTPDATPTEQASTTDRVVTDGPNATTPASEYNTTVTLRDGNGSTLASVAVRIANTSQERYTGLSETESLADGEGMLFVYDREGRHTYVMRNMSFPLDIVFVAANGTITRVHHAETEPGERGDELTGYTGRGQYVLEVPRGYTNQTGVGVGDTVAVPAAFE